MLDLLNGRLDAAESRSPVGRKRATSNVSPRSVAPSAGRRDSAPGKVEDRARRRSDRCELSKRRAESVLS